MNISFSLLDTNSPHKEKTAEILFNVFSELNNEAWPTLQSAEKEVDECLEGDNIILGAFEDDVLIGWVGLRPMYKKTWELHPMVVDKKYQNKGIGRQLIKNIEEVGRKKGLIGIVLGTDDEANSTSLSKCIITKDNIYSEMENIKNYTNHPYEFYIKCGYIIVGVIPDANGRQKPDIWMWKNIADEANEKTES